MKRILYPFALAAALAAFAAAPGGRADDKVEVEDGFTSLFNAAGNPAASLPLHWSRQGLPVGVQLVTRFGDEATLLRLSAQIEAAKPWRDRRPPVVA